jgi:tetratricopeptide (TPR) repeat protein/DNA-binding MarR family transcriptional regulator
VPAEEGAGRPKEAPLLLHLYDFRDYRASLVAPYWVTQGGVAERIGVAQPNVSTLLASLVKRGLVASRVAYVEGAKRPRQVYFLTEMGLETARALLRSEFLRISYPSPFPRPRLFVGREAEASEVREWLASGRSRTLLLHGMPGIGKTTLLTEALAREGGRASVFYYRVRDWTSGHHLLRELGNWLAQHSRAGLKGYVDASASSGRPFDPSIALSHFERDLREMEAVVALDDFHNSSREVAALAAGISQALERSGARLLVASRGFAPPFDRMAVASGRVREFSLSGLGIDGVMVLMAQKAAARKVTEEEAKLVHGITLGNPLFVELLGDMGDLSRPSSLRDFLQREVAARMSDAERRLVGRLCAFRNPVPLAAFARAEELGTVGALADRSLIQVSGPPGGAPAYGMHDTLRSFFYHGLAGDERARAHTSAAGFYSSAADPDATLEYLWHLGRLGESPALVAALQASGETLIHAGRAEDLLNIIDDAAMRAGNPAVLRLKGACFNALGQAQRAVDVYEEAMRASADPPTRARLCVELAHCLIMLGAPDRAERACREGLAAAKEVGDSVARQTFRVRLSRALAVVMIHRLRHEEALTLLGKCLRAAQKLGNRREEALVLDTMGTASRAAGRPEQALRHHYHALETQRALGDHRAVGRSTMSLGFVQYALGKWESALGSLGDALQTAERLRDGEGVLVSTIRIGSILAERGEPDLAEPYLRKGLSLAAELRNKGQSVAAQVALANLENLRERPEAAHEWLSEAGRLAAELGNIYLRWLVALARARALAHAGRREDCSETLKPWRKVAAEVGSRELEAAIHATVAAACFKSGDLPAAKREVAKAIAVHSSLRAPSFSAAESFELAGRVHAALGERAESKSAVKTALELYERFGGARGAERCRAALAA